VGLRGDISDSEDSSLDSDSDDEGFGNTDPAAARQIAALHARLDDVDARFASTEAMLRQLLAAVSSLSVSTLPPVAPVGPESIDHQAVYAEAQPPPRRPYTDEMREAGWRPIEHTQFDHGNGAHALRAGPRGPPPARAHMIPPTRLASGEHSDASSDSDDYGTARAHAAPRMPLPNAPRERAAPPAMRNPPPGVGIMPMPWNTPANHAGNAPHSARGGYRRAPPPGW
jgi:hypothetical protein